MQTLIETLNLYNNAFDALCEAQKLVEQIETETSHILDNNTEPIIAVAGEGATHIFRTPAYLERLPLGTVISVDGVEYMRTGYSHGPWTGYLGHEYSHHRMFLQMLEDADKCEIVHKVN